MSKVFHGSRGGRERRERARRGAHPGTEDQSQQYTEVMQVIGFEESEEEIISISEIKCVRVFHSSWKRNTQKKLQQVVPLIFLMTLA
ncbi:hypothetical protein NPIL_276381 [Nephila pilipes]|uniref:Uncharacterized protein n=1 Tax=Nephila pilipes TaxID=299642 RepID=A0A8X6MP40_NEPPI|nr:hypothetical protein NPIL_276381 [Nephila pilipes]